MYETNMKMIKRRTEAGLAMLRENYRVTEVDTGSLESFVVAERYHAVKQYEIEGVGNLLVMTNPKEGMMQMDTFTITPYYKNLPLFTTDYMYFEDKRMFLKLKYFYCHNNRIETLDTRSNPLLRHLNATGNPMKQILSLAPQQSEMLPLEIYAGKGGCIGLKFNPVYNAQWKETGEWQQSYYAYPDDGYRFAGWQDSRGSILSTEPVWIDEYGRSRILRAIFEEN